MRRRHSSGGVSVEAAALMLSAAQTLSAPTCVVKHTMPTHTRVHAPTRRGGVGGPPPTRGRVWVLLTCGGRETPARAGAPAPRVCGPQNLAPPAGGVMARRPPPHPSGNAHNNRHSWLAPRSRAPAGHVRSACGGPPSRPPDRNQPGGWGARTWHADEGWRRPVARAPAPSSPPLGRRRLPSDCVAGTGGWCPPARRCRLSQPWAPLDKKGAPSAGPPVGAQSRRCVTRRVFAGPGRPAKPSAVAACRPPCGGAAAAGQGGSAREDHASCAPPCALQTGRRPEDQVLCPGSQISGQAHVKK